MKKLSELVITESKQNPLYNDWEIKDYFYSCLNRWSENIRYINLLTLDNYNLMQACKQCEIILNIVEKFADDVNLHFYSAESEEERKKYNSYYNSEDSLCKVFKIVEQLANIDFSDSSVIKTTAGNDFDAKKEVSELKTRFNELVKKCNDKYHDWYEKTVKKSQSSDLVGVGSPVPCDCECCKCGY